VALSIDGLSGSELHQLDVYGQAEALNELMAELGLLGNVRKQCASHLYDAKIALLTNSSTDNKALLLRAQAAMERVKTEIATRREQARILQSLIRATP
jgi:hypothetical protein